MRLHIKCYDPVGQKFESIPDLCILGCFGSFHKCEYDRLCGLVVRVPVYTTEMYCDFCEVRTEFIYVM
jgi:hypothetical protein